MMRYTQTNYRGVGRRRRIGRIVLFAGLAAAIIFAFLALGNVLHDRLEQAAPFLSLRGVSYTGAEETGSAGTVKVQPFVPREAPQGIFCTVEEAVLRSGSEAEIREACAVAAGLYDGLSVTVSGEDGLRFRLTAEEEADQTLPDDEVLRTLADAASEYGLTLSAVWYLPDEVPDSDSVTCAAARELARLGFDEILFTGLTDAVLRERDVAAMTALTDAIRADSSGIRVGFALERDVFFDVDSASSLEILAMYADVSAVDFGVPPQEAEAGAYALECAAALYGSIAYYPLRILIRGSEAAIAAQSAALQEAGYTCVQPVR